MYFTVYNAKTFMKFLTDELKFKVVIALMEKIMITHFMN